MPLPLSPREEQVLRRLAWGHTNKQIAAELGISVKTIETHRYTGFRKVRCVNRLELVRYALAAGWLKLDDQLFPSSPLSAAEPDFPASPQ